MNRVPEWQPTPPSGALFVWRLGLVGLGVGLIGIGIVVVMERGRIGELVLERATSGARALEMLTAEALENAPPLARETVEQALDRFMAHPRADRLGQFDYVDFRLPSGEVLARRHARDVARAGALGLRPEVIRSLIKGALMHDVGKIGIPDAVLLKPGRLTPEEFEVMKRHVTIGLDIVGHDAWLREASDVVGFHHEKFDGSGYYAGRRATQIPLNARIFAVADVFDALTSRRPYKEPLGYDETVAMLKEARQSHFDSEILDTFLRIIPDLYRKMVDGRDEDSRSELQALVLRYFRGDITELMR